MPLLNGYCSNAPLLLVFALNPYTHWSFSLIFKLQLALNGAWAALSPEYFYTFDLCYRLFLNRSKILEVWPEWNQKSPFDDIMVMHWLCPYGTCVYLGGTGMKREFYLCCKMNNYLPLIGKWSARGAPCQWALWASVWNSAGEEIRDAALHRTVSKPTPGPTQSPGMKYQELEFSFLLCPLRTTMVSVLTI